MEPYGSLVKMKEKTGLRGVQIALGVMIYEAGGSSPNRKYIRNSVYIAY